MSKILLFFGAMLVVMLSQQISTAKDSLPTGRVQLELDEQAGALRYELELQDKKQKIAPLVFKSERPAFDVLVAAGKYSLRARVFDGRGVPGPWSAPELVVVTPAIVQNLEQPVLLNEDFSNPSVLRWSKKSDYLITAQLEYQKFMAKDWVLIEKVEKLEADQWKLKSDLPPGRYRWTMKFVDDVYGESKPIEQIFVLKPTELEIKTAASQIEKQL